MLSKMPLFGRAQREERSAGAEIEIIGVKFGTGGSEGAEDVIEQKQL